MVEFKNISFSYSKDSGVYDIDLKRYLIGEIDCVQSFESNSVRGGDTEDTAVALLKFQNESLGTLSVSDTIISPWS